MPKIKTNKIPIILFCVALILVVEICTFIFVRSRSVATQATSKDSASQDSQASQIISSVGKLMVLPQGETPKVATVTDESKLASQPFFQNAQNGDKVLIYQNTKKIILYRPSINKIIDVSVVTLSSAVPSPTLAASVANLPKGSQ